MTIPAALLPLLPDSSIPVIQNALESRAYVTLPPRGSRSLDDIASLILACVDRIQHAESECPTAQDYEMAKQAEAAALAGHQATRNHADTQVRQAAKKAYEDAKDNRIRVGGMIWGTISTVNRMQGMISGEIAGLQAVERIAA
jgi:hypothetical protein